MVRSFPGVWASQSHLPGQVTCPPITCYPCEGSSQPPQELCPVPILPQAPPPSSQSCHHPPITSSQACDGGDVKNQEGHSGSVPLPMTSVLCPLSSLGGCAGTKWERMAVPVRSLTPLGPWEQ